MSSPAARPQHGSGSPNGVPSGLPSIPDHEAAIASAPYVRHRRTHRSRSGPRARVLQLLAAGGNGGAQESYSGLLLRLDRRRYEVHALSLSRGAAVQRLERLGIEVAVIDAVDDETAIRELAAYLRRNEIDLLHAHMYRAEVVGTRAALAAHTPVIVATVHSSRVRSAADVATLATLTSRIDRLIVPSASIAAKVHREGRGVAPFTVVPNGVDLSRFSLPLPASRLRADCDIPADAFLLGTVARLEPEKGHRYLVAAMPAIVAACPDAHLVIVGEGSLGEELRAQARQLPAPARDRVIFTGRREDISALTAELAVAVAPSLREAQGISLLEAMARGKPVVASAVGGIPEVVTDGRDGLLVRPADPAALASAITQLARDPGLRRRMGERGRAAVAERFSIEAMVRRVEAVYDEELLRSGAAAPIRTARRVKPSAPRATRTPRDRAALEVPPV